MALEAVASENLGFLTVVQEPTGYVGGFLATNSWGKPLEFRLTSAVQPSRVQQILYGASLQPHVCGEVIGKTLVEKSNTPVGLVLTDTPAALCLRERLDIPVALTTDNAEIGPNLIEVGRNIRIRADHPGDREAVAGFLERNPNLDLSEPFQRIREALVEARKAGVGQRAA